MMDNEMKKSQRDKYKMDKEGKKKEYKIKNPHHNNLDKYFDSFGGYGMGHYDDM